MAHRATHDAKGLAAAQAVAHGGAALGAPTLVLLLRVGLVHATGALNTRTVRKVRLLPLVRLRLLRLRIRLARRVV